MLDKIDELASEPFSRKILFFDEMLTPSLIRLAYWLGLVAVAWYGITNVFSNGFWGIFETIVFVAIAVIGLRVLAELIMLFFKMQEDMAILAKSSQAATEAPSKPVIAKKTTKKKAKKTSKKVTKKSPEA